MHDRVYDMQYTDSENEWVQFIMGKWERQMDEDAGNTHVIDDREMGAYW